METPIRRLASRFAASRSAQAMNPSSPTIYKTTLTPGSLVYKVIQGSYHQQWPYWSKYQITTGNPSLSSLLLSSTLHPARTQFTGALNKRHRQVHAISRNLGVLSKMKPCRFLPYPLYQPCMSPIFNTIIYHSAIYRTILKGSLCLCGRLGPYLWTRWNPQSP